MPRVPTAAPTPGHSAGRVPPPSVGSRGRPRGRTGSAARRTERSGPSRSQASPGLPSERSRAPCLCRLGPRRSWSGARGRWRHSGLAAAPARRPPQPHRRGPRPGGGGRDRRRSAGRERSAERSRCCRTLSGDPLAGNARGIAEPSLANPVRPETRRDGNRGLAGSRAPSERRPGDAPPLAAPAAYPSRREPTARR